MSTAHRATKPPSRPSCSCSVALVAALASSLGWACGAPRGDRNPERDQNRTAPPTDSGANRAGSGGGGGTALGGTAGRAGGGRAGSAGGESGGAGGESGGAGGESGGAGGESGSGTEAQCEPHAGDGEYDCPESPGRECLAPSPTYATVVPILAQCTCCHENMNDYSKVQSSSKSMLANVAGCYMRPRTLDEWEVLRNWLACGASFDGTIAPEIEAGVAQSGDAARDAAAGGRN